MSIPNERYPGQFAEYRVNPAKGDYEAILGQSKLNITSMDDFLRLTEPLSAGSGGGQPPGSEGDDPNAKPRRTKTPRCTGKEANRRRERILRWMEEGYPTSDIINFCKQLFGIQKRMAQMYIKAVKDELAEAASQSDHLAHLELSKRQHELLYNKAVADLKRIEDPTKSASLLRTAGGLLKLRDQVQEDIRHHRLVTRRDQSPDSKEAKLRRQDMQTMPIHEYWERLENLRNIWWWEFMQHYPQFLERQEGVRETGPYDPKTFEVFMRESYERWAKEKAEVERMFKEGPQQAGPDAMAEEGVDQVLRDLANGKKI